MRRHEWRIQELEVIKDDENPRYVFKGLLLNTDKRRKCMYFAVAVEYGEDTLATLIERLSGIRKETDIKAGPRPRKIKHPTVDVRQMNLFGGQDEKPI